MVEGARGWDIEVVIKDEIYWLLLGRLTVIERGQDGLAFPFQRWDLRGLFALGRRVAVFRRKQSLGALGKTVDPTTLVRVLVRFEAEEGGGSGRGVLRTRHPRGHRWFSPRLGRGGIE